MQFFIYSNKGPSGKDTPYLIDLQANLLSDLSTRLVAPLRLKSRFGSSYISKIHIPLQFGGKEYIAFVSEMAAVSEKYLGDEIGSAESLRVDFISAIDLIFTGF